MKIKDIIYKTPEITEEKLLEFIKINLPMMRNKELIERVRYFHKEVELPQAFLMVTPDNKSVEIWSCLWKGQKTRIRINNED